METNIRIKIGTRIKELRQKKKLTQEKLAEQTGIDYKYIQKIEGKTPPNITIETVKKLADALKTSPDSLLK